MLVATLAEMPSKTPGSVKQPSLRNSERNVVACVTPSSLFLSCRARRLPPVHGHFGLFYVIRFAARSVLFQPHTVSWTIFAYTSVAVRTIGRYSL